MYEFKMPSLGAEMESGKLLEWKVHPGDKVKKHDIIAVVDTDKAAIEVESFRDGTIEKLVASPGDAVPVGGLLALIREDQEESPPPVPLKVKVSAIQQVVAAAMARSKKEIPHYYLSYEIDLGPTLSWLEKFNREHPITERLILATLLLKSTALAVKEHPNFNGYYVENEFQQKEDINVATIVTLKNGGLLAPAILKTDQKKLPELMAVLNELIPRARTGSLKSSEVGDATITVSNLGDYGVDSVFGVIYPPQVAIVGFGKSSTHQKITVTLSADHRVSDGHQGSRFLRSLGQLLQNPENL